MGVLQVRDISLVANRPKGPLRNVDVDTLAYAFHQHRFGVVVNDLFDTAMTKSNGGRLHSSIVFVARLLRCVQ